MNRELKLRHYLVLLALAAGARHGLAIARDVQQLSDGGVRLWPATLYGTLTSSGKSVDITGKLRGNEISWSAGGQEYSGVVRGNRIEGSTRTGSQSTNWTATRSN